MECPECGAMLRLYVDDEEMTEEQLLHLPVAPKKIVREMNHSLICTKRM